MQFRAGAIYSAIALMALTSCDKGDELRLQAEEARMKAEEARLESQRIADEKEASLKPEPVEEVTEDLDAPLREELAELTQREPTRAYASLRSKLNFLSIRRITHTLNHRLPHVISKQ